MFMSKRNILLLDDDHELRTLVRDLLSRQVPDVRFYESSEAIDAYHKFARQKFDLLILDIGLPRQDGYEVLRQMRELPEHMRPHRILILSGHASAEEVGKCWPEPVAILMKPCRGSDLKREVERLLAEAVPAIEPKAVA